MPIDTTKGERTNLFSAVRNQYKLLEEILSGTGNAFALKVAGAGLNFGVSVLLARLLGPQGTGLYFLALSSINLATIIGRAGLDNTLLRFVSVSSFRANWIQVSRTYYGGMSLALLASLVMTALLGGGAKWISESLFGEPSLAPALRLMSLSIAPFSLVMLHSESLKGLRRISSAIMVGSVAIPFFSISMMVFLVPQFHLNGAVLSYVLATILALFLGLVFWRRFTPKLSFSVERSDVRLLTETSFPLLGVAIANLLISSTSTFLLQYWVDSDAVGIYNIAYRTATLTSFVLFAVNSVVAPRFASFYAEGNLERLEKTALTAARVMTLLGLPMLILFVLTPRWVLTFFGPGFAEASTALAILAIGQFVNVITGSVGYILMMCGYERLVRNNVFVFAFLNVLFNGFLIPILGINGAAISTSITVALMNIVLVFIVYRKLGIMTLPLPIGRTRYAKQ
ncbi:MAG: flippase [Chloroflexi bacterium]|nr:MAG: flippase [Chloroflexota bacterium]